MLESKSDSPQSMVTKSTKNAKYVRMNIPEILDDDTDSR